MSSPHPSCSCRHPSCSCSSTPPFGSFRSLRAILREGYGGGAAPTTFANSQILKFLSLTYQLLSLMALGRRCGALAATLRDHAVPHRHLPSFFAPLRAFLSEGCGEGAVPPTLANSQILKFLSLTYQLLSLMALGRRCGALAATLRDHAVPHRHLPSFFAPLRAFLSEGCGEGAVPPTLANSQILKFLSLTYQLLSLMALGRRCGVLTVTLRDHAATLRAHAVPHRRLAPFAL